MWSFGAVLYLLGFFHRVAPAVITDELMRDFTIGATSLGNLSAFYFYSYVFMQVPTGILADRWGPRRLLTLGALTTAWGPSDRQECRWGLQWRQASAGPPVDDC